MLDSYIWLIYRALSGATISGQSESESDGNLEFTAFPKAPELLKPHYQTV